MSDWTTIQKLLVAIPAAPLIATIVTAVLGPKVLRGKSHLPIIAAFAIASILSLALLREVNDAAANATDGVGYATTIDLWTWADIPDAGPRNGFEGDLSAPTSQLPTPNPFAIAITLRADGLTCMMLAMVTFIATLIAIYAGGYMHGDPGYWRFFTYIGLFVFSMTMLVSVSNFVLLYVFWEAVGLCSYLLIGFWYEKQEAAAAGKKAFLVNRVGDFGFALGLFLIWTTYGTLNFHDTETSPGVLGQTRLAAAVEHAQPSHDTAHNESNHDASATEQSAIPNPQSEIAYVGGGVGLAICLLLMLGACGKSAQFPLHVWLPDAMEGPTPVSALIHAATMVTAGVYMVTRCTPLFAVDCSPYVDARVVVACIGCFTALLAGVIAMTQNDLKRVLAYSTISQLGYMFLALGVGSTVAIIAAMFHLFTHAFFKALLFMGAGSVMHAMGGVIDMRKFGGLRRLMPWTFWTFLVGALALSGVWPLAGFFSKDTIVAAVYDAGHGDGAHSQLFWWLALAAFFTAFLTSLYTFRAFWMTFFGDEQVPPEAGHHAHESPPTMTVPLVLLAIGALTVGWIFGQPHESEQGFASVVGSAPSLAAYGVGVQGSAVGGQGAHGDADHSDSHAFVAKVSTLLALLGIGLSAFLFHGHQREVNALARLPVLKQLHELSYGKFFVDQIYTLIIVWPTLALAALCNLIDRFLVDGLVNRIGALPGAIGGAFRNMQNGMLPLYALLMLLGMLTLLGSAVWQTW